MAPELEGGPGAAVVDEAEWEIAVLQLEIAAGAQGGEGVAENGVVGAETRYEGSAVDVVEGGGEEPVVFCVVDFEAAIFWDAARVF